MTAASSAPAQRTALGRAARRLLEVTLAALGALAATLGAGVALVGLCCGGLAVTGAGTAATGGAVAGPWSWLFLTAETTLIAASLIVRRQRTRACCPPKQAPSGHRVVGEGAVGRDPLRQGPRDGG
jgi:hypothetical protein